jgi:hypothetical protein
MDTLIVPVARGGGITVSGELLPPQPASRARDASGTATAYDRLLIGKFLVVGQVKTINIVVRTMRVSYR